jgi:GNAT superfamily N-acetyltransferase
MSDFTIRPGLPSDEGSILALADRLAAFGPGTRSAAEISGRERQALADAMALPARDSALLVADDPHRGIMGILLLESRRDYFTSEIHGHVAILVVAHEAEGQGLGRSLLKAAEDWALAQGYRRLTLTVFTDNLRAKEFYIRQGWRPELETYFKNLL